MLLRFIAWVLLLLGIFFLRGAPEDVVGEIGVPVEALAKTGEGEKGGY